jgi:D-hydroxyproline dehydrogenase subunit gamma
LPPRFATPSSYATITLKLRIALAAMWNHRMFRQLHEPDAQSAITVHIDGEPMQAVRGESVAAIMLRQPAIWVRTTPLSQAKRAPYCMMGVCFDCLAIVDGTASVQTCMVQAADGMRIDRQLGKRSI